MSFTTILLNFPVPLILWLLGMAWAGARSGRVHI